MQHHDQVIGELTVVTLLAKHVDDLNTTGEDDKLHSIIQQLANKTVVWTIAHVLAHAYNLRSATHT